MCAFSRSQLLWFLLCTWQQFLNDSSIIKGKDHPQLFLAIVYEKCCSPSPLAPSALPLTPVLLQRNSSCLLLREGGMVATGQNRLEGVGPALTRWC